MPTISGLVFLETVQALTEALDAAGYQVMLGQSGYDATREEALLDAIIGRRPDGVIVTGVMHSPRARKRLAAAAKSSAWNVRLSRPALSAIVFPRAM